jgi:anti-anti-sigma factor
MRGVAPMKPVLRFDLGGTREDPVLKVLGEFDLAGEEAFGVAVDQALSGTQTFTIDMRETTFLDSSGVRALFAAQRQANDAGVKMLLVDSEAVDRVLEVLGILNTFNRVDGDGSPLH